MPQYLCEFATLYGFSTNETVESRGRLNQFFYNENDASAASVGQGFYGSKASVFPTSTIRVFNTSIGLGGQYYILADSKPIAIINGCPASESERKKQAALDKLTEEEKEILGLIKR